MKSTIKKIISVLFCLAIMQMPIQASPFGEFCRKWAARVTAVWYWNILSTPAALATLNSFNTYNVSQDLKSVDTDGNECFPEFKKYPMYQDLNDIVQREGLPSLDNQKIRVLSIPGILALPKPKREYLLRHYTELVGNPGTSPDGTIRVSDYYLYNTPKDQLAAVLVHESVHADKYHGAKGMLVDAVTPFALHGLYQAMRSSKISPGVYPSITGSLMRIPAGAAIVGISYLLKKQYVKEQEREADAGLKTSAHLSRAAISYLKKGENMVEKAAADTWNQVNHEQLKDVPFLDTMLAKNMSKEQYVAVTKKIIGLDRSHPWESERIAYHEEWIKEAEAKKQQEENKK